MDPVTVSIIIGKPREEVFDYLADIANHAEFTDHFLKDWRLTRLDTRGEGAGARFRVDVPIGRFSHADVTLREVVRPWRIVEAGRAGKFNRIKTLTTYELAQGPSNTTRVELTTETLPATVTDRIMESLGARGWFKRQNAKALRRLREILEEGRSRGQRASVAGR